jgi:hypothetical protein
VVALTDDESLRTDFAKIYELRNAYTHGDVIADEIWERELRSARRLARTTIRALLSEVARQPAISRDDLLTQLDYQAK